MGIKLGASSCLYGNLLPVPASNPSFPRFFALSYSSPMLSSVIYTVSTQFISLSPPHTEEGKDNAEHLTNKEFRLELIKLTFSLQSSSPTCVTKVI
jgi:hypothetical protein